MKLLIALLAATGLAGCVAYPAPYGSAGVYYNDSRSSGAYYGGHYGGSYGAPGYYGGSYGAPGYYGGSYGAPGYYGGSYGAPYVIEQQPIILYGRGGYTRGMRDRDRDGVPNRYDRDRDGDGVRNRRDAFPNDPRRQ